MFLEKKALPQTSPAPAYKGLLFCFGLAVFLLPIDWVKGISAFGEFSIMSSFYVFLPLVCFAFPYVLFNKKSSGIAPELWWFIGLMSFALFLSAALNILDILSASLHGRSGINKVFTTFITFYFGVTLMFVTAKLAQQTAFIKTSLLTPVRLSLLLVFIVCTIEMIGWYVGSAQNFYLQLSKIFRSGYPEISGNDGRLRGVSGEPPSMAVFLGFALIWAYGIIRIAAHKKTSTFWGYMFFLGALFFFVLSGARTAYVMLAGMLLSLTIFPILMRFPLPKTHKPFSIVLFSLFCLAFTVLFFLSQSNTIAHIVTNGDSISNLSRYASNYTAFSMFAESPIVGQGPGQYAFVAQYMMPDWGWKSWEIRDWFTNPARTWPPVFSLPGRLAAELGLIGILAWYIPLLEMMRRLLFTIRSEYHRLEKRIPALGATLFLGMIYVLLQGVAQESFRFFELWVTLGVISAYMQTKDPETTYLGQAKTSENSKKYLLNTTHDRQSGLLGETHNK